MPDHKKIYLEEALRYQQFIEREDYQGNLLPALERILDPKGLDVIDLGTGTGRLTAMFAPTARSIFAADLSHHMLTTAAQELNRTGGQNWNLFAADHRWVPLKSGSADLVISGWSICYMAVWAEDNWEENVNKALNEINRLLRDVGSAIIIETLGTGNTTPLKIDKLSDYVDYLEKSGFSRSWTRTDYQFKDRAEAEDLVKFFFGEEMLDNLTRDEKPILPECTGIWHRHK